ncbi:MULTISPECIES: NADH-quinone oxidoreductase subunit D [unclassified Schaalia]|uniref:NADH-quinone oxidoreductase subunit D n=1 Tax=unclassified Schaalia TaxID=2691889 RepID=UPI001E33170B|nr:MULTISPECIES: NADH-quinone oxidoreductase subunit D [unclassified Schaalia]MCD4549116.1 NADH-quinone oxidoreductase subunit D [Schaalia sp. lx-260]MCD4557304.1 NADH-quinone oxidoreductase subunit D [Schaalia sp. lx-100]
MSIQNTKIHAAASAAGLNIEELPEVLAQGGDWEDVLAEIEKISHERIVLNMGPVHPSTHGVLRLILELDGETVRETRVDTGYLHTGIEKNMEYRTWTQGVTFCTRMDYVAPFFQEVAYCLAVEKLLRITDDVPERASLIRILLMELNRIASHMVAIGTGGNELGATTMMTIAFRGREEILRIFERITGLRMNHAYIRPGGVAQDLPAGTVEYIREKLPKVRRDIGEMQDLVLQNPIFKKRFVDVGYMPLSGLIALGMTGPSLRAAGLPQDLRKDQPYCGYEEFDFDVVTADASDCYNRVVVRFNECYQSLKIINQVLRRLEACEGAPTMVADAHIAWPSRLSVASDGQGNSLEHIAEIMGQSMESLIHHFKLVTEGFTVPSGQVYQTVEHAKGILGVHLVSNGGTRPYRAHFRDPSFANLQSTAMMTEGGQLADVVVSLASIDPVLGGVDR